MCTSADVKSTTSLHENEDWQVTREIYADAIVQEKEECATLRIPISLVNSIAIRILTTYDNSQTKESKDASPEESNETQAERDEFQISPRFRYFVLSEITDPPIVEIKLSYPTRESDCYPDSVSTSILRYPKYFPVSLREPWDEWISSKAIEVLEESMLSFSVCNFVEHETIQFFDTIGGATFSAIIFKAKEFGYYETSWECVHKDDGNNPQIKRVDDIRLKKKLPPDTPSIDKFARQVLKRNWKQYFEYTCPICFCPESCDKGIELPCDHFYCSECIHTYVRVIVDDIQMHRTNPFICPLPFCKANMNVLGSPCKSIRSCEILTQEQTNRVLLWAKDIEHPPCSVLTTCPLSSCGATRGMRMLNNYKTNTFVKCEECQAIFCELCLKRIPKNKVGYDHRDECDETKVLKLIRRYQRAAPEIQAKCDEKLKWIKDYVSSREVDASAALWIKEFASICPTCKNGIERSDGCFHMHCTNCGTHFCYECGEEIFFPFYGTHHCWEREIDEMQFDLFG